MPYVFDCIRQLLRDQNCCWWITCWLFDFVIPIIHIHRDDRNVDILNGSKTILSYALNVHRVNILGTMHIHLLQCDCKRCTSNSAMICISYNSNSLNSIRAGHIHRNLYAPMLIVDWLGIHAATKPISRYWLPHAKIDGVVANLYRRVASIPIKWKKLNVELMIEIWKTEI